MRRAPRHRTFLRQLGVLLVIPLFVMATSYAVFNQNLTVNGAGSSVAYVSNNYTGVTYTKTVTGTGPYLYALNMTVKNNGVTSITAWQVTFDLPPGMTNLSCVAAVTCTQNATTVTIKNGAGNGTIATQGSTSFTFSFYSTTANHTLQNVSISATYSAAYETIAGLTVSAVAGKKTRTFPLTVTITNNSAQPISGWQVAIPVTTTCSSTIPTGTSYLCTNTFLTYTGTAIPIAAGGQYTFSATVTYSPKTWTTTGATVMGKA